MKSELIPATPPVKPQETFPLLRKNKNKNYVVLFSSVDEGVVIFAGVNADIKVGYFSSGWYSYNSTEHWEKLPEGTVIQLTA